MPWDIRTLSPYEFLLLALLFLQDPEAEASTEERAQLRTFVRTYRPTQKVNWRKTGVSPYKLQQWFARWNAPVSVCVSEQWLATMVGEEDEQVCVEQKKWVNIA